MKQIKLQLCYKTWQTRQGGLFCSHDTPDCLRLIYLILPFPLISNTLSLSTCFVGQRRLDPGLPGHISGCRQQNSAHWNRPAGLAWHPHTDNDPRLELTAGPDPSSGNCHIRIHIDIKANGLRIFQQCLSLWGLINQSGDTASRLPIPLGIAHQDCSFT